ncbi:phage baseplate plug family protein [Listeria booriae]|uniref:phage baseplate plug family protein n=1 Tax=Listeria booriae TaxID=1552123 RepID=UPI0016248FA5|nr:hypothetical protein [Listeria booriae]MBC2148084.1 hypothetical protein [Listeria booriae]
MAIREYLPVDIDDIPERFDVDIEDETFIFQVNYNMSQKFFTIDLYTSDEDPIMLGEKLVLNEPLWEGIYDERLPAPAMIPMDEAGLAKSITLDNFMKTVFIFFDNIIQDIEPALGEGDLDG